MCDISSRLSKLQTVCQEGRFSIYKLQKNYTYRSSADFMQSFFHSGGRILRKVFKTASSMSLQTKWEGVVLGKLSKIKLISNLEEKLSFSLRKGEWSLRKLSKTWCFIFLFWAKLTIFRRKDFSRTVTTALNLFRTF